MKKLPNTIAEEAIDYRNCTILLSREDGIWYYSAIDNGVHETGFEFIASYSESNDSKSYMINDLKSLVDEYITDQNNFL